MTPLEIETAARLRYNAVGDDFFPQNMIFDLITQAEMQISTEAFATEGEFTTTSVAGQREYSYPTNTHAIKRVTYKDDELLKQELKDDPKNDNNDPTGTPTGYTIWNDIVILFPTPDTSGDTIRMYTYEKAQTITSSSSLVTPVEYHHNIIDYVLSAFFAKDKDMKSASYHMQLWNDAVRKAKRDRMKRKRGDRFAVVRDRELIDPYNTWVR